MLHVILEFVGTSYHFRLLLEMLLIVLQEPQRGNTCSYSLFHASEHGKCLRGYLCMKNTCLESERESKTPCHVISYSLFVMNRSVIRAICLLQSLPILSIFTISPKTDHQLRVFLTPSLDEKKRPGLRIYFLGCWLNGLRKLANKFKPLFYKDKNQPN